MDKTIKDIKAIINDFNKSLLLLLPTLEVETNQIIESKVRDNNVIERHLDTLLDLTRHGITENLFISLLEYYKTVNMEGAAFYWNEFDKNDD